MYGKVHHSQLKVFYRRFWQLKHWKIRIFTDCDVKNFLQREENQNTITKTENYVLISGFGYGISRVWARKSTTERFATVPERFLLLLRKKWIAENFAESYAHSLFMLWLNAFSILSLSANALDDFFSRIFDIVFSLSSIFLKRLTRQ